MGGYSITLKVVDGIIRKLDKLNIFLNPNSFVKDPQNRMKCLAFLFCLLLTLSLASSESDPSLDAGGDDGGGSGSSGSFQFEGKILPPDNKPLDWYWSTRILIDGGKRVAFIKVIKLVAQLLSSCEA